VEEILRALYRLQQIDLELDELNEGSGDLPTEVEALKRRIDDLSASIGTEEEKLRELRDSRAGSNNATQELRERVKMLNERLRTVRNNKEYEATTNDIASAEVELQTMERSMTTYNTQEAMLIRDIEGLSRQREELTKEMEEKADALNTIRDTHADEVTELHTARESVAAQLSPELIKRYDKIRSAYGDAVVKVRKGACSGCYRAIPPQTLVEMRRLEQLFTCENCGRIIVDEEIASSVTV
jgi:predicted  nucleic acid-binding Zn-ribbon protein